MKKTKDKNKIKKPFYKKWWFWVVIVIIVFSVFANSGNDDKETSDTPKATEQKEKVENTQTKEKKTESKETNKKDDIKKAVEKVVGSENLETFNYVPDKKFSLIKFKGSENLSSKMTVKGMYMDIFNILKSIQSIIDTDVDFNVVYPLQDEYGNVEDTIVIKATFKNKTIKKINFDNAIFENIPDMADDWWNHNAVNLSE